MTARGRPPLELEAAHSRGGFSSTGSSNCELFCNVLGITEVLGLELGNYTYGWSEKLAIVFE